MLSSMACLQTLSPGGFAAAPVWSWTRWELGPKINKPIKSEKTIPQPSCPPACTNEGGRLKETLACRALHLPLKASPLDTVLYALFGGVCVVFLTWWTHGLSKAHLFYLGHPGAIHSRALQDSSVHVVSKKCEGGVGIQLVKTTTREKLGLGLFRTEHHTGSSHYQIREQKLKKEPDCVHLQHACK